MWANPPQLLLLTRASVEVDVVATDGTPLTGSTYVSLLKNDGKVFATSIAVAGKAHFADVPKTELTAQVVCSGYDTATMAADIAELATHLGFGRFRVAGEDWGAAIAYAVAAFHRPRGQQLVFQETLLPGLPWNSTRQQYQFPAPGCPSTNR